MKTIVIALVAALVAVGGHAQTPFTLTGDLSNLKAPAEWVFLSYQVNGQSIIDSAQVMRNGYTFSGNLEGATLARLRVKYHADKLTNTPVMTNARRDLAFVYLEPGKIAVASTDSFSNITVTGSKADVEFRKLQAASKVYEDKLSAMYSALRDARKNGDNELASKIDEQIDSADADANERVYGSYLKANPNSPIALFAFRNFAGYAIDPDKAEPLFKSLPEATRKSKEGQEIAHTIEVAKLTSVGHTALDFTQNDTLDHPVKLSSLRGKYLLVDFWASWCGPCRAENPNLVKTYQKYGAKGFQIISVSLDRPGAKEKWLKAIHDDNLSGNTWTHVSDLQFWNNAVAKQYGIEAIPQNLLLDPNGKIIAKNLRGDKLDKKLSTIFVN